MDAPSLKAAPSLGRRRHLWRRHGGRTPASANVWWEWSPHTSSPSPVSAAEQTNEETDEMKSLRILGEALSAQHKAIVALNQPLLQERANDLGQQLKKNQNERTNLKAPSRAHEVASVCARPSGVQPRQA